ncbi:MAG: hypothetical protein DRJ03_30330 [Chloroflexi bacterium]|nr:MAG: hypothetical protein DRI81_17900 [Chloroflexota bacterium]RLC75391.1 MAG: hypothetical protein DRJ03_30330 [Chloroflexota bacterium]
MVVGGAGNDDKSDRFYPAAYDDYVLAVAGADSSDVKVGTSNYGAWVDVSAPGETIKTTFDGGGYGDASGTSMAVPFAAGLAGLLCSQYPAWSANTVRAQIVQTADDIDGVNPGYAGELGSGRIDAGQALTTNAQPELVYDNHAIDGEVGGRPEPASTANLDVALFNQWADATNVQATLSTSDSYVTMVNATASYGSIAAYESETNATSFRFSVSDAAPYAHDIPFTLNVTADGGYATTMAFTVTTASGIEYVSGVISSDTTWTANKTYRATGNILVSPGVTLTIEPGTVAKFESGKALVIRGTLIADGTPDQQILFTSASTLPSPGDWGGSYLSSPTGGIIFTSESEPAHFDPDGNYQSGSIIRYSTIEYSQGGIQAESAAPFINHNLMQRNYDTAFGCGACSSQLIISQNRILNNNAAYALNLVNGQAEVRQNLIAHNAGAVRVVERHKLISNTITHNEGTWCHSSYGAICVEGSGDPPEIRGNNIYGNPSPYDISMGTGAGATGDVTASGNYWGTTDQAAIQARIYDFNQDMNAGLFTFTPFLTTPDPTAPAFLDSLTPSPASPIGIQTVTFDFTFSQPMDQSIDPIVMFGATTPYTSYAVVDNAQWITDTAWRATYDITSLVPRGAYTISVNGAKGTDGMEIPTDTRFGFTVDYAGEITDRTPPNPPSVIAGGKEGDASIVEAMWSASDPDSSITGYRYAIGSSAGATDIVNWTNTSSSSITRSGLGLVDGQQYWLAVQARNVGGLWSASGYGAFVAGQPFHKVFLPLVIRNQ